MSTDGSTYDHLGGWIPYPDRTQEQQAMSDSWRESTPMFGDLNSGITELPKEALNFKLWLMLGLRPLRIYQQYTSCVGAGGAVSYADAMAGDVVFRGSQESVEIPFPWATWGIGRQYGGMGGRGGGSYGSVQGRAVEEWGYVPIDFPGVPQPKRDGDWLVWTEEDEYNYSWPSKFPVAEATLRPEANKFRMGRQLQIRSLDELDNALAQGYGVTMASNYGSKTMKVRDGFLVATWDGSWAHQMTIDGYIHAPFGKLYLIKNQWGRRAHPSCPYLSQYGVEGAFWVPEADIKRNMDKQYTEVIVHSSTGDFPIRKLPIERLGIAT